MSSWSGNHKNLLRRKFSCDALLIENKIDLYYLTGFLLSAGKLLVHSKGAYLFVDSRYFELCQKASPFPVILENKTALMEFLTNPENSSIRTLAFDIDNTSYKRYLELQGDFKEYILTPMDAPIKFLRTIKDQEELAILREAALLGSEGFDFVCSLLREGISEIEVAMELEIFWKRRGSQSLAFDPIIAFGANSSMPHYRSGKAKLQKGDIVLIDIGVNFQHYNSDMTRTVFFHKADPKLLEIHSIVEGAQQAALALCRPGATIVELDRAARDFITAKGYGDRFTHGLGHGVGLEVHEWPVVRQPTLPKHSILESGMVITIEPGIYIPDLGGVRIENTIVITPEGYEDLTDRPTAAVIISIE